MFGKMKDWFIKKILQRIGQNLFGGKVGQLLKGSKTMLLALATFLIGALNYFAENLQPLAETFCASGVEVFCDFEGSQVNGAIMMIVGFLQAIIRTVTDLPLPSLSKSKS